MFRPIIVLFDPTRRISRSDHSALTFVAFSFAMIYCCISFQPVFVSTLPQFETVQMVETPLGLIKVEKNVMSPTIESFKPLDLIVKITKPKEVFVAEDDLAGIYGDCTVKFLGDETRKLD